VTFFAAPTNCSMATPAVRNTPKATDRTQERSVRESNIIAAKAVADAVRTSLGPRGMDKMIQSPSGEVVITNDGATILKKMQVSHPTAKMLVNLSASQDVEAGDGTTTVTVIAGAMLNAAELMLKKGIHPTVISESFLMASKKSVEILKGMSVPVDLADRDQLIKAASTSLNSKVISNNASLLAPLAVDALLSILQPNATNVDLKDIAVVKRLGGTIDDTELVKGLVFTQKATHAAGGPTKVVDAKIGLIQFCLSAPKTDIEQNIVVSDYSQMDRILKEERKYILDMCKTISKSGCNVLLIQKSILRDAVNELSLHFLAKMKILVVKDIEREDVEFICKTCGCVPIANVDTFHAEKLGKADLVQEQTTGEGKVIRIEGVPGAGKTCTLLCKASNKLVLDESERSLHDALCVLRCLVKQRFLTPGGGAPEMQLSYQLSKWANTLEGMQQYCVRAFAEAMEVVPYTLAENAGLDAIQVVTELRNRHANGETNCGINVRKGRVTNILEEHVLVPLLVHTSAISLATECVRLILKIDDIVITR
jgi:T-complex protein 1 subunit delta